MATFLTMRPGRNIPAMIERLSGGAEPRTVAGIRWWHVGGNASHSFYLGLDAEDALWESAYDGDIPEEISFEEEINRNRRPVKDGDQLYLGR